MFVFIIFLLCSSQKEITCYIVSMAYSHPWSCQQRSESLDYILYCCLINEMLYGILQIKRPQFFIMIFIIKKRKCFPINKTDFGYYDK